MTMNTQSIFGEKLTYCNFSNADVVQSQPFVVHRWRVRSLVTHFKETMRTIVKSLPIIGFEKSTTYYRRILVERELYLL